MSTAAGDNRRLWVGGLPHSFEKGDILRLFEGFGTIVACEPRKGFAFLEYEHPEDAAHAVKAMHGHEPERGRVLLVEFRLRGHTKVEHRIPETYIREGRGGPPQRVDRGLPRGGGYGVGGRGGRTGERGVKNWRLELEGLTPRTAWQEIKDWGKDAGLAVEYTAVLDRGHGTIEFASEDEMLYALKVLADKPLDGVIVDIYPAKVQPSGPPSERARSSGAGRDRSRSPQDSRRIDG